MSYGKKYEYEGGEYMDREHWPEWSDKTTRRVAEKFGLIISNDGWLIGEPSEEMVVFGMAQIVIGFRAKGEESPEFCAYPCHDGKGKYQVRIGPL